jgi:3-hydroxybutyryl-CoA dehydrogenase
LKIKITVSPAMNIAIVGNDAAKAECIARLGDGHQYQHFYKASSMIKANVVFDFSSDWTVETLKPYATVDVPVFLNTAFTTFSHVHSLIPFSGPVFGFCGLPSFFNREVMEVYSSSHKSKLKELSEKLGVTFMEVKDQVGFVTPRVVAMIINEAHEALRQGVASKEDIDLSMKLGTNYPFGPFEWCDRIGKDNVRNLLIALEMSTGDVRYRPNF